MITEDFQVLRVHQVCALTGLSRSSLYAKMSPRCKQYDNTFPRPFKLGASAVGWNRAAVIAWIKVCISHVE
jgi:prophage regulatory protein